MKKPASLRRALAAALPEIRNEPDRLLLWVETGAGKFRMTGTLGLAFEYPLTILLREVSTDIAIISLAICRWLMVNQPALLVPNKDTFNFETDIFDNETADILFTLNLTENVAVTANPDGSFDIDYLPEPDPLFDDNLPLGGEPSAPGLTEVITTIVAD